jgi:hypothetical protein
MTGRNDPLFLSLETVYLLHRKSLQRHGGLDGVRDEGAIESALARPRILGSMATETNSTSRPRMRFTSPNRRRSSTATNARRSRALSLS